MIGAKYVRDIENGEIVVITESGLESIKPFKTKNPFQVIYNAIEKTAK